MTDRERGRPDDIPPAWEEEQTPPPIGADAHGRQDPRGEPTVGGINTKGIEQLDQPLDEEPGLPSTQTGAPD